jgi:hypothetical protein
MSPRQNVYFLNLQELETRQQRAVHGLREGQLTKQHQTELGNQVRTGSGSGSGATLIIICLLDPDPYILNYGSGSGSGSLLFIKDLKKFKEK